MGDGLSQSDLDALFGAAEPEKKEDGTLSQSDLDALFGNVEPEKKEDGTLSQSDLDTLFGGIEFQKVQGSQTTEAEDVFKGLDWSQLGGDPNQEKKGAKPESGGESMSQDEIDALLKEFLG